MTRLQPVRVVVADDHPIWRSGIRADLGENFHVVGDAGDAPETIALVEKVKPDLVLCDLQMPKGGGIAVVKACAETVPVVILTVSEAERDLLDAVSAGAMGYLLKSSDPDELRSALWKAAQGEPVFSPSLAGLVLREFRRMSDRSGPDRGAVRARARGDPARGPRAHLQGDRRGAPHLAEDGGEPRPEHPGEAPAEPSAGAHPLRRGAWDGLTGSG